MSFSPELNHKLEQAKQAENAQQQALEALKAEEERLISERHECFRRHHPDLKEIGRTAAAVYNQGQLKPTTVITRPSEIKFRDWRHREAYQDYSQVIEGWSITRCRVTTPGTPAVGRTATGELDLGDLNTSAYQDLLIAPNGQAYLVEHQGANGAYDRDKMRVDRDQSPHVAETTSLSRNPLPLEGYLVNDDLNNFPLEAELLEGIAAFMRRSHLLGD